MTPNERAAACAASMWADDRASQALGMTIDSVAPGQAVMSMVVTEAMTNGHGTCHGGYIFTLADSAFAFACNTYNQNTVGQQAAITYIAPAFAGEKLVADAREISRRGRGGIYDVTVTNPAGETIAIFRGHSRTVKGTHLPEAE